MTARTHSTTPAMLRSILTASVVLLASCGSTPKVWRSAALDASAPVPTLRAAAVYDYFVPEQTYDLTGIDLRDLGTVIGKWAEDNPDQVLRIGMDMINSSNKMEVAVKTLLASASGMDAKLTEVLSGMGFQLEIDAPRAAQAVGGGTVGGDYTYVVPGTAARPFGEFPMFGPGSKGWTAKKLASGRAGEAFISTYTSVSYKNDDPRNAASCTITVLALDAAGDLVFDGQSTGASDAAGSPQATLLAAFDQALAGIAAAELR